MDLSVTPVPELVVAAIITRSPQGHTAEPTVLLSKRPSKGTGAGMWHLAGGRQEFGETWHQAVVRENQEELDIVIEPLSAQPDYVTERSFTEPRPRQVTCLHFRARIVSGTPTPINGSDAVEWCTPERVRQLVAENVMLSSSLEVLRVCLRWNV